MNEEEWNKTDYPERCGFLIGFVTSAVEHREEEEAVEHIKEMLEEIGVYDD